METWLGQGVIMPTLNQLPTLKLPDWDEDPDLPELESIDEIEAREAAKMALHGAEGEGGDLVVHDAWQETMSGQAGVSFRLGVSQRWHAITSV